MVVISLNKTRDEVIISLGGTAENDTASLFKGTVSVISSDLSFREGYPQVTTVIDLSFKIRQNMRKPPLYINKFSKHTAQEKV